MRAAPLVGKRAEPITILESGTWSLERQRVLCRRDGARALNCHLEMLHRESAPSTNNAREMMTGPRTVNVGSWREGRILRQHLGYVVVRAVDIVIFLRVEK